MIRIETHRLIIRDNRPSDLEGLFELTSDPVAMRFMKAGTVVQRAAAKKNLRMAIRESRSKNRRKYYFAIIDKAGGAYIGAIGYEVEEWTADGAVAELGYFIKPAYWKQGIVTEAGEAVLAYAFTEGSVAKMTAGCLAENSASERIMQKLGMTKEAHFRLHQWHEGQWKDRLAYGLRREDWKAPGYTRS